MSRPRKNPDPKLHAPCARCNLAYPPAAIWSEGTVCTYCYMAAKRARGTCSRCGHTGIVPGLSPEGALCRPCSGIKLNVDCRRCGGEDELYSGGRCWKCAFSDQIHQTLSGPDGEVPSRLQPLASALLSMPRSNSGMTWIRQKHVASMLHSITLGSTELTHQTLDALPRSRTVEYLRGLLIEHEILSPRDRYLAEFPIWADRKLSEVMEPAHRSIMERFIRWHQLKRLRNESATAGTVSRGLFLSVKQSTTVAVKFLNTLTAQGKTLSDVDQRTIDGWYASGPSTNALAELFLYWAMSHKHIRKLDLPRRKPANPSTFGHEDRIRAIRMVMTEKDQSPGLRVAAGLVLLYGQPLNTIASLTLDRIRISDSGVELRFASEWLPVPDPFASVLRDWTANRANLQTAAHTTESPWLFPGAMPGQHLLAAHISSKLRTHGIPAQLGRTTAWRQMVREAPPSVLAELLGMNAATAMRHADLAGANFARYAALQRSSDTTLR